MLPNISISPLQSTLPVWTGNWKPIPTWVLIARPVPIVRIVASVVRYCAGYIVGWLTHAKQISVDQTILTVGWTTASKSNSDLWIIEHSRRKTLEYQGTVINESKAVKATHHTHINRVLWKSAEGEALSVMDQEKAITYAGIHGN